MKILFKLFVKSGNPFQLFCGNKKSNQSFDEFWTPKPLQVEHKLVVNHEKIQRQVPTIHGPILWPQSFQIVSKFAYIQKKFTACMEQGVLKWLTQTLHHFKRSIYSICIVGSPQNGPKSMTLKKNPSKNASSFQVAINLKIFGQGWSVALTALKHSTFSATVLKPRRWKQMPRSTRPFPGGCWGLWKWWEHCGNSSWIQAVLGGCPGQPFGGHGRLQLGHVLFSEATRKQKIMAWRCLFTPCFTTFHFMKLSNWLFQPT